MTRIIKTAILALISLSSHAQISETRRTGNFSKIEVESGIELIYSESEEVSVKAEASNEKNLKNIVTELKGKTLKVYYISENNIAILDPLKVYINANNVNSFEATSKSKLVFKNSIKSDIITISVSSSASFMGMVAKNSKVIVKASSGATICGRFDTEYLAGDFKSGATAVLSGIAKKVNISTISGAFCTAKNLSSENASISAKKLSSVLINAKGMINANAETGSSISYFGKPKKINLSANSFCIAKK